MTQERNMDKQSSLVPGQLVRAKAGRDKGSIFLVLEILDSKFVHIVNGKRRTLEHPKRKRVTHLQPFNMVVDDFEAMKKSRTFNNARIKKLLQTYDRNEEDC